MPLTRLHVFNLWHETALICVFTANFSPGLGEIVAKVKNPAPGQRCVRIAHLRGVLRPESNLILTNNLRFVDNSTFLQIVWAAWGSQMAKFSEVFSTTFKVVAALIVISLGASVIYLFVAHANDSSKAPGPADDPNRYQAQLNAAAEAKHTSMPLSKWNKLVAAATKQHCAFEGMHKDDVEKALGKPTETAHNYDNSETWTYALEDQKKCVKYDGEKCVEHPKSQSIVFLTPGGYVYLGNTGPGCYEQPFFGLLHSSQ